MTGFPFGWYHYSDALGPKLFLVPLLIGPAYFGMGYLSWALARAILGDEDARLAGLRGVRNAGDRKFRHGGLGSHNRSDGVDDQRQLGMARRRELFRRACEQFPRLVSDGVRIFPMLCFLRQKPIRVVRKSARILDHAAIGLHGHHHCAPPEFNSRHRTDHGFD